MKVRLTSEAINRINRINKDGKCPIKYGLQVPMGREYTAVWGAVRSNEWNGALTKEAVLLYLEDKFGMKRSQFLEIVEE